MTCTERPRPGIHSALIKAIARGLGVDPDEHMTLVISALAENAEELGLVGTGEPGS